MKANELRIGNWYHFADNDGIVYRRVKEIKQNEFGLFGDYDGVNFEICQPIPLTEEWLVRFGFYKNIDTELFEKGGYQIDLSVLKCHFYLPDFGDWYKELEYVHQLQNLYFALTGEELTLSE